MALRRATKLGIALLAAGLAALAWVLTSPEPRGPPPATGMAEVLSGGEDFERVWGPRKFQFPADHGAHPEYKSEWWYFTGNLETPEGRHFGYQFTLFRFAIARGEAERPSHWAANQAYMGHFTITDVREDAFHPFERLSRAALGLAGAQAEPFKVWLEDWSMASTDEGLFPLRIQANADGVGIELYLDSAKPLVLQGQQGYSPKSREPGNASYYYSFTHLPTQGEVRLGRWTYPVTGLSWMDREWSTSALAEDQVGWDWFSLQLSNGEELMYYQLRMKDGTIDPSSSGTYVRPDGSTVSLSEADMELKVLGDWTSSETGARYPSGWRLRVPKLDFSLRIQPYVKNQELDVSVRYWEGAVRVEGSAGGQPVSGSGYVEMTGY
jgi:predicted secreted hydrolase